ncbi:MAG: 6-phosphofructokinase [Candidatus Bathyarchaeota archaeon]|nr:6-phosphofructokinase [Candidatus Bathyarchaeota archaeon]
MQKIGVVTAGGDAPGMNAAIRSVVRTAIFHGLKVVGIERGYAGLIEGKIHPLNARSVSGIINRGGTVLKTARCEKIKTEEGVKKAADNLKINKIDGLIVIGGDGSFRGASELYNASGIPVVGVPATIDNDVAGTETTIGFDTAVNTALFTIDRIRDTATSHERVFVVEVMGRKRGFLALAVGFAEGAEFILVPELKFDIETICKKLKQGRKKGKTSEIIVMAESAGDSSLIVKEIKRQTGYDVRLTILGHALRGGAPTAQSRILANQFGAHAVELLLKGAKKRMAGVKGEKIVSVDLDYSWQQKKNIDKQLYRLAEILSS